MSNKYNTYYIWNYSRILVQEQEREMSHKIKKGLLLGVLPILMGTLFKIYYLITTMLQLCYNYATTMLQLHYNLFIIFVA